LIFKQSYDILELLQRKEEKSMETVNQRIAWLIGEKYDGNRSKFAREVGITPAYAAQIYSGERIPSDRTISDISRECSVNRVWLETGVGEPFQPKDKREELKAIFADVLSGRPSEKNAFIEAVAQLPDDVFPVMVKSWIASAEEMKRKLKTE
jgi:transcriptional regulator with XRE-family HTH domain